MLQRTHAAHPGLLLVVADPDQRRWCGDGLLSAESPRVLHHLQRVGSDVLDVALVAAIVVASAIAGWSALYGP